MYLIISLLLTMDVMSLTALTPPKWYNLQLQTEKEKNLFFSKEKRNLHFLQFQIICYFVLFGENRASCILDIHVVFVSF